MVSGISRGARKLIRTPIIKKKNLILNMQFICIYYPPRFTYYRPEDKLTNVIFDQQQL